MRPGAVWLWTAAGYVGTWRYGCRLGAVWCFCQVAGAVLQVAGAVLLVLSGAAGAEEGRQKSVVVGMRAGCRAVDSDIVASGGWVAILPADVQARGDIVAGVRGVFLSGGWVRFGWFYLVRRERRTDGRKASSLACGQVAAPLIAILLPAGGGLRFCRRMCRRVAAILLTAVVRSVFARWLGAVWLWTAAGYVGTWRYGCRLGAVWCFCQVAGAVLSGGGCGLAGSIWCDGSGGGTAEKRRRWHAGGLLRR